MRHVVLIPAYQPDQKLLELLTELSEYVSDIVIVDDGSGTGYGDIFGAAREKAKVISYEVNRGKGGALKEGLTFIRDNISAPYAVVTADADGQHTVRDILRLFEAAEEQDDALILGSRKIEGRIPFRSRFGNTVTRAVFHLATGRRVYDTQTGLRAFSDRQLEWMLQIPGDRYEYEMNVLMYWVKQKKPISEIWIQTIYTENNESSHFNPLKDSFRIYREILKFSGSSLVSFLVDYGLFCLFYRLTEVLWQAPAVVLANVCARLISAAVNYCLNRRVVFHSNASVAASAGKYAVLALGILIANTLVLKGLVTLGLASWLAKLLTEVLLFGISFYVQHRFVFRTKRSLNSD